MNTNILPPWLALPEEVRRRVAERMAAVPRPHPEPSPEDLRHELQELGMFRLIRRFRGDVQSAIKYCHQHRTSFEPWDPQGSTDPKEWMAADKRTKDRLKARLADKAALAYGEILTRTVREELARYNAGSVEQ
jgi:hypothetical protein